MHAKAQKFVRGLGMLVFILLFSETLMAQGTVATLVGTIKNPSGAIVPDAKVSLKNVATQQSQEVNSDSQGHYSFANSPPGEYELSVAAQGYSTNVIKVTLEAGATMTQDVSLGGVLSLGDLGFPPTQTQGSTQEQARLDKRSHMLKVHQRLGLITTAPLVATVIYGTQAGGHSTSTTNRNVHAALGSATAILYGTTAYYAIFAPKISGTPTRGPIRFHKAMAWIHGPGMILTPILGAIAFDQKAKGEHVHGIAQAHGPVAIVTAGAYGAAILAVTLKW